jgi:hypothetical protein
MQHRGCTRDREQHNRTGGAERTEDFTGAETNPRERRIGVMQLSLPDQEADCAWIAAHPTVIHIDI